MEKIDDNVIFKISALNLSSGLCYNYVLDNDFLFYGTSFHVSDPDDVRKTNVIKLNSEEQARVCKFIENDFFVNDYKETFDYDIIFNCYANYNGKEKSSRNNHTLEARIYNLVAVLTRNHDEFTRENLHIVDEIKPVKTVSSDFNDYGHLHSVEPVLKKIRESKKSIH